MEVAERLRVEGYRSIWTPAKPTGRGGTSGENDGNVQTTLEILQIFGHPFFWHFDGSRFGSGSRILFHRRQCTGSQPGQNGAGFGVRTVDSHATVIAADFNM